MMFNIDLLKGRGVPVKSGLTGMAFVAITIIVPLGFVIAMLGSYLNNKIVIAVEKSNVASFEKKISSDEIEHALRVAKSLKQQERDLHDSLSEVSSVIGSRIQWTVILETVVKNMPTSMVMTRIEVKKESRKVKIPKEDDPEKMVMVTIPVRILRMSLMGDLQDNYDEKVRDFRDSLLCDELLSSKLEEIRVAQEFDKVDDRDVVSYEMYLVFKPIM
jgi:hypothetical protein